MVDNGCLGLLKGGASIVGYCTSAARTNRRAGSHLPCTASFQWSVPPAHWWPFVDEDLDCPASLDTYVLTYVLHLKMEFESFALRKKFLRGRAFKVLLFF